MIEEQTKIIDGLTQDFYNCYGVHPNALLMSRSTKKALFQIFLSVMTQCKKGTTVDSILGLKICITDVRTGVIIPALVGIEKQTKIKITVERDTHLKIGVTWSYIDGKCPECGGHIVSTQELKACEICNWKNYEVIE